MPSARVSAPLLCLPADAHVVGAITRVSVWDSAVSHVVGSAQRPTRPASRAPRWICHLLRRRRLLSVRWPQPSSSISASGAERGAAGMHGMWSCSLVAECSSPWDYRPPAWSALAHWPTSIPLPSAATPWYELSATAHTHRATQAKPVSNSTRRVGTRRWRSQEQWWDLRSVVRAQRLCQHCHLLGRSCV
jgi:hypothetical protein